MLCQDATLLKYQKGVITASPLYCKAWTCEICRPRRKKQLIAQARAGDPDTFITLTVNPHWFDSPEERAARLAHAWRTIVAMAKRYYGYKTIPYMCFFEATERGEPHLHILARCKWIDQAWLAKKMAALMGAPVCDIRRVRSQSKAAYYVTKYCGKAPGKFGTCKRYWGTRDYCQPRPDDEADSERVPPSWHVNWRNIYTYVRELEALGFTAEWDGDMCHLTYRSKGRWPCGP